MKAIATSEENKVAYRRIKHLIENEGSIITYRQVARQVRCHINTAKKYGQNHSAGSKRLMRSSLLLNHLESNSRLSATYILSGRLQPNSSIGKTQIPNVDTLFPLLSSPPQKSLRDLGSGPVKIVDMDERSEAAFSDMEETQPRQEGDFWSNDKGAKEGDGGIGGSIREGKWGNDESWRKEVPRFGVVLARDYELEDKKTLFDDNGLSIHVYSLASAVIKDPAKFLIPSLELHESSNLYNPELYGTISGKAVEPVPPIDTKPKLTAKISKDNLLGVENKPPIKENRPATSEGKKGSGLKNEIKAKSGPSRSTSKTTLKASGSRKRIVASDTEDDESESTSNIKRKSNGPPTGKISKSLEPTSSMVARNDRAALEAMASMEYDSSKDEDDDVVKKKNKEEVKPLRDSKTGRKVRRIKKTRREKDKKGYVVSKDYWTDESYDESETDPGAQIQSQTAVPNRPAIRQHISTSSVGSTASNSGLGGLGGGPVGSGTRKAGGAGKSGGQSTLMGFFKKK
nr:hypothetical protein L204_01434 [Cryptococcus depauperatus CBS 7855]